MGEQKEGQQEVGAQDIFQRNIKTYGTNFLNLRGEMKGIE